jgi:hypothetical protein
MNMGPPGDPPRKPPPPKPRPRVPDAGKRAKRGVEKLKAKIKDHA